MRGLIAFVVVLLVAIGCLGFYRGWFAFSSENAEHKSHMTLTVDQDKIQADEKTAKEKVQNLGHKVKDETGKAPGTTKEEDKDKVPDAQHKVKEKTGELSGK